MLHDLCRRMAQTGIDRNEDSLRIFSDALIFANMKQLAEGRAARWRQVDTSSLDQPHQIPMEGFDTGENPNYGDADIYGAAAGWGPAQAN